MRRLTQSRLKELLAYSPETGVFVRRKGRGGKRAGSAVGCVVSICGRKYRTISIDGWNYSAHRLAFLYMTGEWPEQAVDHKDGDGLNNIFTNLRAVTQQENLKNKRLSKNNTLGIPGVYWMESRNRYRCEIGINGRGKRLGNHLSFLDACAARKSAELVYGYFPNHGSARP